MVISRNTGENPVSWETTNIILEEIVMKISYELNLNSFDAWSGAIETLDRIRREGKCEELEVILEELYPDGMDETELNDLLWFDGDTVFEWLGLRTESQIQEEIYEVEEELEELCEELEELCEEDEDYKESYNDVQERIKDAKDRIDELNEEKAEF